jgi:hypothetical protein
MRRILNIILPEKGWRRRRALRRGCGPFGLGAVAVTVLLAVAVTVINVPSFISDPFGYRVENGLAITLIIVAAFNVVATWLLGVLAARSGARAARGQGQLMRPRLAVARRQMLPHTLAVIALRVVLILTLVGIGLAVVASTSYFDNLNDAVRALFSRVLLAAPLLTVLGLHLLGGPVLRMFYSTALGAFGASTTSDRDARISAALTARAIAGVVGIVALVWGVVLFSLLLTTINQPISGIAPLFGDGRTWPLRDDNISHFLQMASVVLALLPLHMLIQVGGSLLMARLTRRRLAQRPEAAPEKGWLQHMQERYPT